MGILCSSERSCYRKESNSWILNWSLASCSEMWSLSPIYTTAMMMLSAIRPFTRDQTKGTTWPWISFFSLFVWDGVSLCYPGCSWSHNFSVPAFLELQPGTNHHILDFSHQNSELNKLLYIIKLSCLRYFVIVIKSKWKVLEFSYTHCKLRKCTFCLLCQYHELGGVGFCHPISLLNKWKLRVTWSDLYCISSLCPFRIKLYKI
jgi:hypothetical protein